MADQVDVRTPEAKLQDLLEEVFRADPTCFLEVVSRSVPRFRHSLPDIGTVGPRKWWFDAVVALKQPGLLRHAPFWADLEAAVGAAVEHEALPETMIQFMALRNAWKKA